MPPTSVQRLLFNDVGNGNGSGKELTANERQQILDATINAYIMRDSQVGKWLDPRRDYDQECGYKDPRTLSSDDWRRMYDEDPIARRIVGFLPEECWQKPPEVYEDEDPNVMTDFEDAWQQLARSLRGESWFQDQEGNPIWEHLARLDRLSRVGQYGVMLLGLDDGEPMNQPVKGLEEDGTKPAGPKLDKEGKPTSNKVHFFDGRWRGEPYILTFNAEEGKKGMGLKFLRSFSEDLAMVTRWESNPASPRFGQPVLYNVYLNDTNVIQSGTGLQLYNESVHWSRVLHVADGLDSSEWLGTPSCRPVYKRLVDLTKLYGGSAEMYWQGAFPGYALETHPQLGGDVQIDKDDIRLQMKHMINSLQRYSAWSGMSLKMLSPTVVDPTQQIKVQIEAICILLGVPMRIFMGSERGELASSTDDTTWTDRVGYRRLSHITPRLIVPFIDRLILLGILPQPTKKRKKAEKTEAGVNTDGGYSIVWPDMKVLSEQQRATVAQLITQCLSVYVQTGVMDLMEPLSYMTKVLGWSDKESRSYLEATVEKMKEQNPDLPDDKLFAGKPPQQPGMGPDGQPLPPGEGGTEGGPTTPEDEGFTWPEDEEEPTTQEAVVNAFCPTGEGGGKDNSCSSSQGTLFDKGQPEKVRGEKVKREIDDAAKKIQFDDKEIDRDAADQISDDDYDAIEERMTGDERSDMMAQLESKETEALDSYLEDFEADVDEAELARENGYSRRDVKEAVEGMIEEHAPESEREELKQALDSVNLQSWEQGEAAYDKIVTDLDNLPESLQVAMESYQQTMIEELMEARDRWSDSLRESAASDFDWDGRDDARREYLNDFYAENKDRYLLSSDVKDGKWYKTKDGGAVFQFSTSQGGRYTIDVYTDRLQQIEGRVGHEVQFNDGSGSFDVTGAGASHEVFSKVVPALVAYVRKTDPDVITFSAAQSNDPKVQGKKLSSRQKLYDHLVKAVAAVLPDRSAIAAGSNQERTARMYAITRRDDRDMAVKVVTERRGREPEVLVNELRPEIADGWWVGNQDPSPSVADLLGRLTGNAGYFGECERDEKGRCKAGGGSAKPAPKGRGPKASKLPETTAKRPTSTRGASKGRSKARGTGRETAKGTADCAKCDRAKKAHVMVGKDDQARARKNEGQIAKILGGASFEDSEPADVIVPDKSGVVRHGLEVKSILKGKNDKITMDKYAQVRKVDWESRNKTTFHTVIVDDRDPKARKLYYKRGVAGSARLAGLHQVKNAAELKLLVNASDDGLPEKAKRTDQAIRVGKWKPIKGERAFKNTKTGQIARAKK